MGTRGRRRTRGVGWAIWVLIIGVRIAGAADRHLPASVDSSQREALAALEKRFGPVQVAFDAESGTARWLSGRLSGPLALTESGARTFLTDNAALLGISDPGHGFVVRTVRIDARGVRHIRFERVVDGIPVLHSSLTLHQGPTGVVTDVTGGYARDLIVTRTVTLGAEAAMAVVQSALGPVSAARGPTRVVARGSSGYVPAWRVAVRGAGGVWDVIIDASEPRILRKTSLLVPGFTPTIGQGQSATGQTVSLHTSFSSTDQKYYLYDFRPEMDGHALRTSNANHTGEYGDYDLTPFVSADDVFTDTAAVDAHRYVADVYDWYWTRHGWSSWDGAGGGLFVAVHAGWSMANAFWDVTAKTLAFGDGDGWTYTSLTSCKDIVAHEFTHGVVDGTVALVYELQSGALNESLADSYGTFLDPPIGLPTDYQLGESCAGPGQTLGYMRHVLHPELAGDPSHFYDFKTLANDEWNDYGGVHTNSGIPNKAMALLVSTLGVEKTEAIYFQLLYGAYIAEEAQFQDFRNGMISACAVVHGAYSSACKTVDDTFALVGLFGPGKAPKACPSGSTVDAVTGCRCKAGYQYDYDSKTCVLGSGACGDVSELGTCVGDTLKVCWYGDLEVTDCSLYGMTCDFDWDLWQYGCAPAPDDCGGVPSWGQCYGNVLQTCVGGELQQTNCAWVGKVCVDTWYGAECQAQACVPSCWGKACGSNGCGGVCGLCDYGSACDGSGQCVVNQSTQCGNVDLAGTCQYDTLKYCENGMLYTFDCSSAGLDCLYQPSQGWYDCASTGEPSQCGSLTGVGTCSGSTLKYCDHNKTYSVNCSWSGLSCGWDATTGEYACLGGGGCGGITYVGECLGGTVWWCDGGLQSIDCAAKGKACGYNAAYGYFDCIDVSVPTSCGSVTYDGYCQGSTLVWCDGGAIQSYDCAAQGEVCGYEPAYGYYDCVPAGPTGCGSVGSGGTCQGNVLVSCAFGTLVKTDCGASGQTCAATGVGTYGCVTVSSCGGVTEAGLCVGNTLELCVGGQIVSVSCAQSGLVCALVPGTGKVGCVAPSSCGGVPDVGQCTGSVLKTCAGGSVVTVDCAAQGKTCGAIPGTKSYGCLTPVCVPSCVAKVCGSDGCGGSCGACALGGSCVAGQCVTACGTLGFEGQCAGSQLSWCDHGELLAVDCKTLGTYACGQVPGTVPPSFDCLCVPACAGKACGDDGCGGTCGACAEGAACLAGQCVCTPACAGKACGPNGCGGTCGVCGPGTACVDSACYAKDQCGDLGFAGECDGTVLHWCAGGKSVSVDCADLGSYVCGAKPGVEPDDFDCLCAPDCAAKACGGDGCGGTCGACAGIDTCVAGQCVAPPPPPPEDLGGSPIVEPPLAADAAAPEDIAAPVEEVSAAEPVVVVEESLASPEPATGGDAGSVAEAGAEPAPAAVAPPPASGGCASGRGAGTGAGLLVLALLVAVRRRRAALLVALFAALAGCAASPTPVEAAVVVPDTIAAETTETTAPAKHCGSDADCAAKGEVCDPLPGVCVACLFTSDCGAGPLRCIDRTCVAQTPCTTSLDCKGQVCDLDAAECVECLTTADCGDLAVCLDRSCRHVTPCTSSLQCTGEVCDKERGFCVTCVEDADCPEGSACVASACVARAPCKSDLACTPSGLVCDKVAGWCVQCLSNAECPDPYHCTSGACLLDLCHAAELTCDAGQVRECLEDGSAWGPPTACGPSQACAGGACHDTICEPGATLCDQGKVGACNATGTAIAVTDDCAAKGMVCAASACAPKICEPGLPGCDGDYGVHNCNATGAAFGPTTTCASGSFCQAGACAAQVCAPGAKSCSGHDVVTCDAKGSGPGPGVPCGADEVCLAGACLPKACEPNQKTCKDAQLLQCDATGTAPTLTACPAMQTCVEGACVPWTCQPGKAVCEGGVAKLCNATGSAWAASTPCAVKTELCLEGACLPKVCEPSTVECANEFAYHACLAPGLAWAESKACSDDAYCEAGFCVPQVCTPLQATCDGASVVTCNAAGSGPIATVACPAGETCDGGACKALVCDAGTSTCVAGQLATCNALGTVETQTDCPLQHTCLGGQCVAWVCEPEKAFCASGIAKLCDVTGTSPATVKVCAVKTEVCVGGECVEKLCNPGALECDGDFAFRSCEATGAAYGPTKACPAESYCDGGACLPQTCAPGSTSCDGQTLVTCNAKGSGAGSSVPCGVGSTCIGSACVPVVCTPGAKSCQGAKVVTCNGLGTSLIETSCAAGQSCNAGNCMTWVCTPGTAYCDGSVARQCNEIGTASSVTDTCAAGSEVCVAGACLAKVCTAYQKSCDGDFATHTCSADGTGYAATIACPAATYCEGGTCKTQACAPFTTSCISSTLVTCNSVGSGYQSQLPCGDGKACIDGACVTALCQPGTKTCQSGKVATCNASGQDWVLASCPSQQYCGTGGACKAWACTPDTVYCTGQVSNLCDTIGSGPVPGASQDCAQAGLICSGGVCTQNTCTKKCVGKTCGDDGCGGSCGSCAVGLACTAAGGCQNDRKLVPAGQFWMGCNTATDGSCQGDEYPQHSVTLDAFFMDTFEVTAGRYAQCVSAGACSAPKGTDEHCSSGVVGRENHPMNCVAWPQAQAFCGWMGGRLPTEAEWEKAARGGCELYGTGCPAAVPKYVWGSAAPSCTYAVFDSGGVGCGTGQAWDVGSKPLGASPYGLHDMAGNVWEWTGDWWDTGYFGVSPSVNPTGPSTSTGYRAARGGALQSGALLLRAGDRGTGEPDATGNYHIGFRCAFAADCSSGTCVPKYCVPQCGTKTCGDNGCGGSCGTCTSGWSCTAGACKPVNGAACGSVTTAGYCDGKILVYCDNGALVVNDCATSGYGCGWVPEKQWYDCVPQGCTPSCSGKQCGGDGCGGSCGSCVNGWDCVLNQCQPVTGAACGTVTTGGQCFGNLMAYCAGGTQLSVTNCAASGKVCGWLAEKGWYDCIGVCTPSCSGKTCGDDGCGGSCGTCGVSNPCGGGGVANQCGCAPAAFSGTSWASGFDNGLCGFEELNMGFQTSTGKMIVTPVGDYVAVTSAAAHDGSSGLHVETTAPLDTDQYIIVKHFPESAQAAAAEVWMRSTKFQNAMTSWAVGFTHKDGRHAGSVAPFSPTSAYYVNPSTHGAEGVSVNWPLGQWFKVRLERDVATSTVKMYINGELQVTAKDADTDPIDGFGVGWQSCCGVVGGGDIDSLTVTYTPVCKPACGGKTCGDDGCGGLCGTCTAGWTCASGACTPTQGAFCDTVTSTGKCFGGTLATCTAQKTIDLTNCAAVGQACTYVQASGKYACTCVPSCAGKTCGSDGCGGSCGACSGQQLCGAVTAGQCGCKEPPVIDNTWSQGFETGLCGFDLGKFATVLGVEAYNDPNVKVALSKKAAHNGQYGLDTVDQVQRQLFRAFDPVANVAAIEAWFKGPTVIIGFAHADNRQAGFFHVTDSWNGGTRYANPTTKNWESVTVSWDTSKWTLVRAERDSATGVFRLFMNGQLAFEKTDGDLDLLSGAFVGLPQYGGSLDEVRVMRYPFGCQPSCLGKACGDDGCGGSCGSCALTSICGGDLVANQCQCPPDPVVGGSWFQSFDSGALCGWDALDQGLDWTAGKVGASGGTDTVSFTTVGGGAKQLFLQTKGLTGSGQYLLVKYFPAAATTAQIQVSAVAGTMTQAEHSGFVVAFLRKDGAHVGAFEFDASGKGAFYNPITKAATPITPINNPSGSQLIFRREAATGKTTLTFAGNTWTMTDADTDPFDGFAFGVQTSYGGLASATFDEMYVTTYEAACTGYHLCSLGGEVAIGCNFGTLDLTSYACPTGQSCAPTQNSSYCSACPGGGTCTTCVKALPLPKIGCTSVLAGATASASTSQDGVAPAAALDGNVCSGWTALTGAPAAWQVDLPSSKSVSAVTLVPALSSSGAVRVIIDTKDALGQWVARLDAIRLMAHGQPYHLTLPSAQTTTGVRVRTISMPVGQPAAWLEVGVTQCP